MPANPAIGPAWQHDTLARSPVARLLAWAALRPTSTALLCQEQSISYAVLSSRIQAAAAWLYRSGVRQGDTVAFALAQDADNTVLQVELFYGLQWLGAVVLPLYAEVTVARHGQLAKQFGAHWLLAPQPTSTPGLPCLDLIQYAKLGAQWTGQTAPRGDDPERPLIYEFTSGTTGTPKAILFTGAQYTTKVLLTADQFGWCSEDAMVLPLRWPTKVGVKGMLRIVILGATYVDEAFPETRIALDRLLNDRGVSYLGCTPWQLRRLLASPPLEVPTHRQLRALGTAGAYIAPHEIQAVRDNLTANFHVAYGCTEIGPMGHLPPHGAPEAPFFPIPGMQAQAVDAHGNSLATGLSGRLRFRAPWLPTEYANNPVASQATFQDGWFVSSDVGSVDVHGNIRLLGRSDEVINVGGSKIQPSEVEPVLLKHPDIADVAVLGVPDAMAGELAVAFLVLRRSLALDTLVAFLSLYLDPWQIPSTMLVVDRIPRNPGGKTLREPLRAAYAQFIASQQ